MKISKDSWHFKFLYYLDLVYHYQIKEGRIDSCAYRSKLWSALFFSTVTVVVALLAMFVIWIPSSFGMLYSEADSFWVAFAGTTIIWLLNGLVIFSLVDAFSYKMPRWFFYKVYEKKPMTALDVEKKQRNILVQQYRQLKDRICTKVEFDDGN